LAEVLATLASTGSSIVIGTTADRHNNDFAAQLLNRAQELGVKHKIHIVRDRANLLHEKAITADDYAVVGSMNITWNGINVREEYLELRTDEEFVARARLDATDRFGRPL
jgi:phosphatidylserine/phosphatidylglycerophosphate/cardiolipin synthase-like enzyme